ncbi:uncharacterized protein LOC133331969 [Musca vetustissima]|uniref:uncharacterized protein LOC133331969 n=1 Tax=Musca vetustissima TaxID=27455 RepID=UPI002AB5E99F|nr:uncharacterized protein LOC133331969 [Musca vetustissima]
MSYLLTEIALEMLGYKFYDIYGVPEDINNFQNLAATDRGTDGNPANAEPHLATILGLDNQMSGDRNTTKRNHSNLAQTSQPQPPGNSTSSPQDVIKVKIPELLAKLTDIEINKVKEQVLRNKPSLPADSPNEAKSSIPHLIELQHQKLSVEQQNLQNFRKYVELSLMQFNPVCFEKYLEMFKGT